MAYNSDGYIMIDFTEVDFRRTNQTIDGLYKRCVDVIGTNKFILVINANGRTPLPATCSFTNNQYVIDTVIYMFAVSSNDNLFIRRNDVPASDIIDDSSVSVDKTWSSNKIDTELDRKADASALADYQPKLTAGTNITIDENNVISSTGGAVIDDNVMVNNKVWSSLNTVEMLAPIDTVVGSPATFKTSLEFPIIACKTSFTATQEGTGNPSPTNVRNIVGVDDITLTVNGNDIVIDLDGTRYGGLLDFVTGIMTITDVAYKIKDLAFTYYPSYGRFVSNDYVGSRLAPINNDTIVDGLMCECYISGRASSGSGTQYPDKRIAVAAVSSYLFIYDSSYTDVDTMKSAVGNYYIKWKLKEANYITIQLSPTELLSIIGTNSIGSDTGAVTVSYKALPIDLL